MLFFLLMSISLSWIKQQDLAIVNLYKTFLTLTRFQPKKCKFAHPFSDYTSKIHTRFQTWLLAQSKKLFKSISNSHIRLYLSLLIWNWNDKCVHTHCGSLESHSRFQTKMGKVCTCSCFQNKTAHWHRDSSLGNRLIQVPSYISIVNSMICSDIWHKYHKGVKFETFLKYHE